LALHNVSNRYVYTLGREGIIPRAFSRTHHKTASPWLAGIFQSGLACLVLIFCVLTNADPYDGLLLLGSAIGFLCIILLWALCSLAVWRYLRRNHLSEGLWKTTIAPVGSFLGLTGATALVIVNFDLYSGGDPLVNFVVFTLTVAAAIGGLLRAWYLKKHHPRIYSNLASLPTNDSQTQKRTT